MRIVRHYNRSWKSLLSGGCLSFVLAFTVSWVTADGDVEQLFPESGAIPGWTRDGEVYVATDEASLAEFINGAAPFYIEHGAVEVGFQDYVKEDVFLTVEIYRMKDEEHARRLYADIHAEDPEPVADMQGEGRFVGGLIGVYLVEYWQRPYFIRLTVADKSAVSKEAIVRFAGMVSENIEKGANHG